MATVWGRKVLGLWTCSGTVRDLGIDGFLGLEERDGDGITWNRDRNIGFWYGFFTFLFPLGFCREVGSLRGCLYSSSLELAGFVSTIISLLLLVNP